ncbi:hypothetical protein J9A93_29545, partial [Klebsiella pneumoniae]
DKLAQLALVIRTYSLHRDIKANVVFWVDDLDFGDFIERGFVDKKAETSNASLPRVRKLAKIFRV